jgi:phosphomannomutase
MEIGAITAGEESGGYAFAQHLPERDGCFGGLLLLDLLARSGKTPSELVQELFSKVGRHFYDRLDVHLSPSQRQTAVARIAEANPDTLAGRRVQRRDQLDGYRFEVDGAWLLLRPSGTEPLLRVYTETTDVALVKPLLDAGRELAGV